MATVKTALRDPGWTTNLSHVPHISMSDVVSIIQEHSKVPGKHLDKGYKFFHGSYVHDVEGRFRCQVQPCMRERLKINIHMLSIDM